MCFVDFVSSFVITQYINPYKLCLILLARPFENNVVKCWVIHGVKTCEGHYIDVTKQHGKPMKRRTAIVAQQRRKLRVFTPKMSRNALS